MMEPEASVSALVFHHPAARSRSCGWNDMQALLDAVRAACSGPVWSRGVELARVGAVFAEEDDEERVTLRVRTKGGLVCPVTLFPRRIRVGLQLPGGRAPCCEHVAAAAIALAQARREGLSLTAPSRSCRHAAGSVIG